MTAKQSKGYTMLMDTLLHTGVLNPLLTTVPIAVGNGWDILVFPTYEIARSYLLYNETQDCIRTMSMLPVGKETELYNMDSAFIKLPNNNTKAIQLALFKTPQHHKLYGEIVGWTLE